MCVLHLAVTIYLDSSLIKIYLEIWACIWLNARRGMLRPVGAAAWDGLGFGLGLGLGLLGLGLRL